MTSNLKVKGKMASLTENRRLSWELIVWPLILELDRPFLQLESIRPKEITCLEGMEYRFLELDLVLFL